VYNVADEGSEVDTTTVASGAVLFVTGNGTHSSAVVLVPFSQVAIFAALVTLILNYVQRGPLNSGSLT